MHYYVENFRENDPTEKIRQQVYAYFICKLKEHKTNELTISFNEFEQRTETKQSDKERERKCEVKEKAAKRKRVKQMNMYMCWYPSCETRYIKFVTYDGNEYFISN